MTRWILNASLLLASASCAPNAPQTPAAAPQMNGPVQAAPAAQSPDEATAGLGDHAPQQGGHAGPHSAHTSAHTSAPTAHASHGKHARGAHAKHARGSQEGDQRAPLVHGFKEGGAHWVKRFEGPERDASQKPAAVVAAMGLRRGMTVADIGSGTGYFLPHLSPAVGPSGRVLALDIEPSMIRFIKTRIANEKLANVEPRLVLTDDPLLPAASVDRIMVVNTWHHIPHRKRYAKLLAAALKPQGSLWIIDFTSESPHGPPKAHRLTPQSVKSELASAGLTVTIDDKLLAHQYVVVARKPRAVVGKPVKRR